MQDVVLLVGQCLLWPLKACVLHLSFPRLLAELFHAYDQADSIVMWLVDALLILSVVVSNACTVGILVHRFYRNKRIAWRHLGFMPLSFYICFVYSVLTVCWTLDATDRFMARVFNK